jgi:hypothetical protein
MSKARKTLNVADTVASMNATLQRLDSVEGREAMALAIEDILLASDRYRGFRYTNLVEVYEHNGEISLDSPDESFRHYFCSDT